jgi:hypothetical protein
MLAAGVAVAVALAIRIARRRAARRRAEARARSLARRRQVPLVSANVRGRPAVKPDIWREEADAAARRERGR